MRTKIDIRRAIKERFGTIAAFAEKSGMRTQNIIQNMIKGNPSVKKLEELCEKMDCDVTDLFYPIESSEEEENNTTDVEEEEDTECQDINTCDSDPQSLQTTAFCPHCGAKVRVGVVLLPE